MEKRHWNSLVTSIRHGQCILVLGPEIPAGTVSAGMGDVSNSFAEALRSELAKELEEEDKRVTGTTLAAVAQQYEDAPGFGAIALRALAETFYKSPQFVPSDIHSALAQLPFRVILTTCHDDLMAHALQAAGKTPIVQRYHFGGNTRHNPEFSPSDSPQAPLLYHLFGSADEPDSLVLSENDLLDFIISVVSDRPPLPSGLRRTLKRSNQSFLFIGFGITHWYLRVLLKVLMRSLEFHRSRSNNIATEPLLGLSEDDREQTILFYKRGTAIELEDAEIGAFLTELNGRLEAAGGAVSDFAPTRQRAGVFISYAREDSDLANMTAATLRKAEFEPFLDVDGLRGGELWDERIRDEINAADFALVLYSPALCRKMDSYVNREIHWACERGHNVRGGHFLIPLRTTDIPESDRIAELSRYHEMPLRPAHFGDDIEGLVSCMRRELQRRQR